MGVGAGKSLLISMGGERVVSFGIAYRNSKMCINFHSHRVELATAASEESAKTFSWMHGGLDGGS